MFDAINPYFYSAQIGQDVVKDIVNVMRMNEEEKEIMLMINPDASVFLTLDNEFLAGMLVNILAILN